MYGTVCGWTQFLSKRSQCKQNRIRCVTVISCCLFYPLYSCNGYLSLNRRKSQLSALRSMSVKFKCVFIVIGQFTEFCYYIVVKCIVLYRKICKSVYNNLNPTRKNTQKYCCFLFLLNWQL